MLKAFMFKGLACKIPRFAPGTRRAALLVAPFLLAGTLSAGAQNHDSFYNGVRDGGRGASYDRGHDSQRAYSNQQSYGNQQGYPSQRGYGNQHGDNQRNYQDDRSHQGGIGPGKGALIGGAGGALLGGIFGGGLKGSLIGGAAGAGIGAIAGQAHQNSDRRRDDYRH